MREIFTRLLKALWVFNIVGIVGFLFLLIAVAISAILSGDGFAGFGEVIVQFIGISLLTTAILVFLQYVLLGNFNPKILFKRENR